MWLRCLCGLAVGVLQTAEAVRLRCLEAQELIGHLQTFSCHSAGSDFSKLPPIFTNDATLAEAAVSVALMHGPPPSAALRPLGVDVCPCGLANLHKLVRAGRLLYAQCTGMPPLASQQDQRTIMQQGAYTVGKRGSPKQNPTDRPCWCCGLLCAVCRLLSGRDAAAESPCG